MRARVLDKDTWIGGRETADLRAVVSDLLSELDGEDGHPLVRIHTDQDRCADLRVNLFALLEALLDVVEDRLLAEIVEGEQILTTLHVGSLHGLNNYSSLNLYLYLNQRSSPTLYN